MQKALMEMNVELHHVLSDITGQTGMKIISAMLSGERDPLILAQMRHARVKSSTETIVMALTGDWRVEHLFTLGQALESFCPLRQHRAADGTESVRGQLWKAPWRLFRTSRWNWQGAVS